MLRERIKTIFWFIKSNNKQIIIVIKLVCSTKGVWESRALPPYVTGIVGWRWFCWGCTWLSRPHRGVRWRHWSWCRQWATGSFGRSSSWRRCHWITAVNIYLSFNSINNSLWSIVSRVANATERVPRWRRFGK